MTLKKRNRNEGINGQERTEKLPPERTPIFSLALGLKRNPCGGYWGQANMVFWISGWCGLIGKDFDVGMPIQIIGEERQHFACGPQFGWGHT